MLCVQARDCVYIPCVEELRGVLIQGAAWSAATSVICIEELRGVLIQGAIATSVICVECCDLSYMR